MTVQPKTLTETDDLITYAKEGMGYIVLNRPQALNALTLDMIRSIAQTLRQWNDDQDIHSIVFKGEGGRAFCAGGDIKATYKSGYEIRNNPDHVNVFAQEYFREEYDLNLQTYKYPKPIITMMNGITMGGGYGLAGPSPFRVIDETSKFAMPEVGIGLFPDVGAVYKLSRMPDYLGYYLALTGSIINPADMMITNIATHHITPSDLHKIFEVLQNLSHADMPSDQVKVFIEDTLNKVSVPPADSSHLEQKRSWIKECFAHETLEDILAALENSEFPEAKETADLIKTKSPTSLRVTHEYLKRYQTKDFEEILQRDYILSQHFMRGYDFYEGVRAQVIDKDRNPKWQPEKLSDVPSSAVSHFFE